MQTLEIKKINENAQLPFYANRGDAGMDICSAEEVFIKPGQTLAVSTGLIVNLPEGYELQIRPRSGLSLKTRLRLPNSPGTIDSGYKDELKILIHNASPDGYREDAIYDLSVSDNPPGTYHIQIGDRIAQMVLAQVVQGKVLEVKEFAEESVANRGGGFGSSGIKL